MEPKTPVETRGDEERIPLRGIRRTIAKRMVESKHTAPHVTLMDEIDATELIGDPQVGKRSGARTRNQIDLPAVHDQSGHRCIA